MCSRGRRRIVCTINGSEPIQRALLSQRNGKTVVTLNRPFMEKLKISIGSTVLVTMKSDDSRYGLPVPEELSEMFRQDSEGKLLFHGLTPGRQRTLLNLVGIVKKSDTRAWRAAVVTRHLKHHKGHIVYRLLYRELSRR